VAAKLDVVENGVSLPAPSDYCPDGPVLSVGRLVAHKRMDVVIDACARLNRPLIVAGAGPELAVLQEQATRLGANVRFTGFLSHDELDVLYRQASVLVLASESEGQPNAVLEGMAHARPVVVTPVGGIPDLVDDGVNGLLMPYGDPSALASALARLAEDPDSARRMGVAARQTVEQFTWERMISKLELTLERWR
jgi:glycosyltransferase involved in cell wall biosynthesis